MRRANEAKGTAPAVKDEQLFDRPLQFHSAREAVAEPRTGGDRFAAIHRPDNFPGLRNSQEDRYDSRPKRSTRCYRPFDHRDMVDLMASRPRSGNEPNERKSLCEAD